MSPDMRHVTIAYRVAGDPRQRVFHTYAKTDEQAVQDLFNNIPDVDSGEILFRLNAPAGARRLDHDDQHNQTTG